VNSESKKPSKVTPVVSGTRAWSSGNVKFTVLAVEGHPEKNYIALQKHLVGKTSSTGLQRFLMNLRDWTNLKQLVEVELPEKHQWVLQNSGITVLQGSKTEELAKLAGGRALIPKSAFGWPIPAGLFFARVGPSALRFFTSELVPWSCPPPPPRPSSPISPYKSPHRYPRARIAFDGNQIRKIARRGHPPFSGLQV
jgi:hypothetical protein